MWINLKYKKKFLFQSLFYFYLFNFLLQLTRYLGLGEKVDSANIFIENERNEVKELSDVEEEGMKEKKNMFI